MLKCLSNPPPPPPNAEILANFLTIFKSLYSDICTKGTCSNCCSGSYDKGVSAESCQRIQRKVAIGCDVLTDFSRVQGCDIDDVICNDPIPILQQWRIPCQDNCIRALCHANEILWRTTGNCKIQKKIESASIYCTKFLANKLTKIAEGNNMVGPTRTQTRTL